MDENLLGRPARHLPSSALPLPAAAPVSADAAPATANAHPPAFLAQNLSVFSDNAAAAVYPSSLSSSWSSSLSLSLSVAVPPPVPLLPTTHDPIPAATSASVYAYAYAYAAASASRSQSAATTLSPDGDDDLSPDDFYRTYPQRPRTSRSHTDSADLEPSMTTASPRTREPRPPLRPSDRLPVSSVRSVSSPISNRIPSRTNPTHATNTPNTQRSVRDLTKQFDRPGPPPRPSAQRPNAVSSVSAAAAAARSGTGAGAGTGTGNAPNGPFLSYSSLRTTANATPAEGSRTPASKSSQRPKFAVEDQYSSNTQSFASRISKPSSAKASSHRSSPSVSSASQASRSMSHLPSKHPPRPSTADLAPPTLKPLLFGEISPQDRDKLAAGHGIDSMRLRRTSESGIKPSITANHNFVLDGNLNDEKDDEGDGNSKNHDDDDDDKPVLASSWHGEDHEKLANGYDTEDELYQPSSDDNSQAPLPRPTVQSPKRPGRRLSKPVTRSQSQTPSSRLPLSARKIGSQEISTTSPTPPSRTTSRANSPALVKRTMHMQTGKSSHTTSSRAGAATQASTPSRKPPPIGLPSSTTNSSLAAYISAAPPKLSPPLRSSRPRQPVSAATTASSRQKIADRPRSPIKMPSRQTHSRTEDTRKKPPEGRINFAERREHVKLAYTKSIRETSDAIQARKRIAARRRKEAAEAQALASRTDAPVPSAGTEESPVLGGHTSQEPTSPARARLHPPAGALQPSEGVESPVLCMPGTFPLLPSPAPNREPLSAASGSSTSSDVTQFDNEPQTEPPVPCPSPSRAPPAVEPSHPAASAFYAPPTLSPIEYQYPFDGSGTTSPSEDLSPTTGEAPPGDEPTQTERAEPSLAGGLQPDYEPSTFKHPGYETSTTVTILPRQSDTSPFSDGPKEFMSRPTSTALETPLSPTYRANLEGTEGALKLTRSYDERREKVKPTSPATRRPPLADTVASYRDSYASQASDGGAPVPMQHLLGVSHSTTDTPPPNNLMVPSRSSQRLSQASTWTDFSIDSNISPFEHVPSSSVAPVATARPVSASMERVFGSQQGNITNAGGSNIRSPIVRNKLPELDTSEFVAAYLDDFPRPDQGYVPVPNHSPPPVPTPGTGLFFDSRRTSTINNGYYNQSNRSSIVIVRNSEDTTAISTPQSMEQPFSAFSHTSQAAFDPSRTTASIELSKDKSEAANKERHRLAQRRLVLKELVDTEAVFVRDMNVVEEIYKGTAEACPELDPQTIKLIFRNTEEIINFHTLFLAQLKDATATVYPSQARRPASTRVDSMVSESTTSTSKSITPPAEADDVKDRATEIGPVFQANMDKMKTVHEGFLRNSDHAAKRLIQIQQESTVKVWLAECNEVAKELTAAWDLDSLLIKPMQRITKYPNIILTLLQHTPQDHPDREALIAAKDVLETAIIEINKTKKNFELVGQIVGRKRKESDVKAGFARAFGKRVDKLQASSNRPPEDATYQKLQERFGDDYLRLQVVLRDVEYYTRAVADYVTQFMNYLSSIELVMRIQSGSYPELESKWVQFNVSMREIEKVALDQHLSHVRKHVIEPFEQVIKSYGNPSLAMKKRAKRRLDYEKAEQLKKSGKTPDAKLGELVEQYDALNDTLKKELPKLSELTVKVGYMCLGSFINIQTNWFRLWKDKVRVVLADTESVPEVHDILAAYQADFKYVEEHAASIGLLNQSNSRVSQSTGQSTAQSKAPSIDENLLRVRGMSSVRGRGLSLNGAIQTGDCPPSLPTPDFAKRHSGQFALSPTGFPSPHQYHYRDYYAGIANGGISPLNGCPLTRPGTGRSFDSGQLPRQSSESSSQPRRDSSSTYNSNYPPTENKRYSGLFHSALPMADGMTDDSRRSSRASSRERPSHNGYNILWLAASLFEFNIETTKHEAGYPYLTYQAGEIFDVIAEKGELWLAKNQDDPRNVVGWIWSKHFAKLADS